MSELKLPETVKVGPFIYTVEAHEFSEEDDTLGQCMTDDLLIQVETSHPDSVVKNTLLHEIFHAIYDLQGLNDENEEEQIVYAMSNGLQLVLLDNPGLKDYL